MESAPPVGLNGESQISVNNWDTFEGFKADLESYIRHWNNVRRQVKLKGLTPVEFREQALREAA